jgi:type III protein arginine methyltransferase
MLHSGYAQATAFSHRHAPARSREWPRTLLDIGTGSGLLAMHAAKAGASHVYAFELDQRLALTARDIFAANGLADRVTILPVHSTELDRDRDLAGGADLVISEISSDDLLGESVLCSLGDVQKRLCRPGAIFLPSRASIRVAVVGHGPEGPVS